MLLTRAHMVAGERRNAQGRNGAEEKLREHLLRSGEVERQQGNGHAGGRAHHGALLPRRVASLRRRVQRFRRVCAPERTGSARCTRSQPVLGPVAKTLHSPEEEARNRSSSVSERYKTAAD